MRIMIKGGVWKNTEDEILKAAVMKYGKNQWARISSLLVRKSAKQCKARWYEWLDPSIKKTEWTREEDEKLLHLAKLMPTQWRTIAPIVGRTPSQCLERYEKLLDAACVKDENYEPADDPRKLRPGEIDPNPESKPARPDPVDMDEDEKEMLSEARARLANTRGKKAKRKAREKQLEEARRLASLQKRRELKAAGIEGKQRRRKRKGIDYNAEIPFEKKPPPGFFDTAEEERQVEQPQFPTTIEELEGKRRVDIEAQLRKQDIAHNKIVQRRDTPSAVMQVNKLNDPEAVRKRSKLMLPAPQISDRELEEIAKMGYASDLVLGEDELADGNGATRALLGKYGQTPRLGMTPLRTPQRTPGGKGDAIMLEAENLARLREAQTPLFGGENPELHPSDFSGVTPKKRELQTPNPIATPLQTPGAMGLTPRSGMTPGKELSAFGTTPKGTPIRDELHINEGIETPDGLKSESRRQAEIRRGLRAALGDLPAPKNEYQIVVPELPPDEIETGEQMEEDMSEKLAREQAEEAARQAALLRKRSKVLQRDLPRPPIAAVDFIKSSLTRVDDDNGSIGSVNLMEQADELVRKELMSLLEHDNAKYPSEEKLGKEKRKGSKGALNGKAQAPIPHIDDFDEEELKEAAYLIEEEVSVLRVAMGHEDASLDDFAEARDACLEDMMYFPIRNSYGLASVASSTDKLAALQNEFETLRNQMEGETRKAVRLEQKLKVLTQGYQMRADKLWMRMEAVFKQASTLGTELECFRALHRQEELAASNRVVGLREAVNQQKDFERKLQLRYENLLVERDNLQRLLEEHKAQLSLQKDNVVKNDNDIEQSQSPMGHVNDNVLEDENDSSKAVPVSSELNDAAMLDGLGVVEGQLCSSELKDDSGEKTSLNSTKAVPVSSELNDVAMLDGLGVIKEGQLCSSELKDDSGEKASLSCGMHCDAESREISINVQTGQVVVADGQNAVLPDEDGAQVEQQKHIVESSIPCQIEMNKEDTTDHGQMQQAHEECMAKPSIPYHNEINKEGEPSIPCQNEIDKEDEPSIPCQNEINKEDEPSVPCQNEINKEDASDDAQMQQPPQDQMAESPITCQNEMNKKDADDDAQVQHSQQDLDILEQVVDSDVSLQLQPQACGMVENIMNNCNDNSKELLSGDGNVEIESVNIVPPAELPVGHIQDVTMDS